MSARVPPGGPYCDFDLRRWWVAVEDCGYLEARRLVKGTATLAWDQKLVYVGRQPDVHLWDDEACEWHDDEESPEDDCDQCRSVMAWAFEVVDR